MKQCRNSPLRIGNALLCAFLALVASGAKDAGININHHKSKVTERTFDRNHMPPEMPPLHNNEAAVTVSQFAISTDVQAEVLSKMKTSDGTQATVKITGVTLEPSLSITIWLPTDATQKLRDHEYGHRKISQTFYDRVPSIARELARLVIGKTYRATADNPDAAVKAAISKAIAEVNTPLLARTETIASKVQDKYDALTDHGRNDLQEDEAINRSMRAVRAE